MAVADEVDAYLINDLRVGEQYLKLWCRLSTIPARASSPKCGVGVESGLFTCRRWYQCRGPQLRVHMVAAVVQA